MTETATKRPKCIGIGRILGHRFSVSMGEYVYKTPYCGRCGFVPERLLSEQADPPRAAMSTDGDSRPDSREDQP